MDFVCGQAVVPKTAVTAFANANIEKRRKSMNGKRVRMAVMSAVILSALAVSGCSSEGSVSYNGSGEKADDVSASLSAPVTSDTTNSSESKETQEQTSSESKPAVTTTNKAETTAVTTKKDNAVKSEWKETKADGTKYVTVGCYSREKAVLGAKTVKLYNVNDKVTVVAVTDTGYAKLKDGTFIHNDFLSDSKVTVTAAPTSQSSKKPTEQKPAQSQTSEYSWVIKPSYVYDEVAVIKQYDIPFGEGTLASFVSEESGVYKYKPGKEYKGIFTAIDSNGKWGLIDSNGKKIIDNKYDKINISNWMYRYHYIEVSYLIESYANYSRYDDYWLDSKLNEVHPSQGLGSDPGFVYYYDIDTDRIYFADLMMGNRELSGNELSEIYKPIVSAVTTEGETISLYGKETLQHNFYTDKPGTGMYGLISGGKITVPMEYDGYFKPETADEFGNCNRIVFWKNNKIYVFDKNGKCYSNGKYDKVDNENQELYYFNGYLPVCKGGKWGLIDVNGKEVVKCRFEDITSVYDGKAWAKENGKWGVIKLA